MSQTYDFEPKGVCSVKLQFTLDDDQCIHDLSFVGGCNGNLKAIGRLVEGKPAREVADILAGNDCKGRGTSCADQLSIALNKALALKE